MTRLSMEVLDKIIQHNGQLVPDYEIQHGGCSKRKRNLRDAATGASRIYKPTPEVASAISKRSKQLRRMAKSMSRK